MYICIFYCVFFYVWDWTTPQRNRLMTKPSPPTKCTGKLVRNMARQRTIQYDNVTTEKIDGKKKIKKKKNEQLLLISSIFRSSTNQ